VFYDGGVTPDNNACSGGVATFFISSLNFGDHGKTAENEQTIFLSYRFSFGYLFLRYLCKG
jgi:hypothetical protein